ncbi:uncharacterized protein KD926_003162 [Aspergillus affinis]|uniref:uncharacterized protein n=1 Tax=Aspergillus affinis TaxID=1070780 RepID=UPI0022FDDF01|nr:uncharacterized protein KD926_003162 [Aspergillus affinis]KAI9035651.1 hypothetical protein KD926_003162 [Aspergillus affinis]
MGQEILVTTDDLGVPTLRTYQPSNEETPTSVIPPQTIKNLSPEYTFVFIHPDHLESVFHNAKTHEQIACHMRRLRLVLLNPVASASLTSVEENGGTEGPNIAPLFDKWWTASRAIPRGHGIKDLIFDVSCPQEIQRREIVRVLQGLSTTLAIKSDGHFECCVEGCDEERKEWLEKSLVNRKKSGE